MKNEGTCPNLWDTEKANLSGKSAVMFPHEKEKYFI